MKTLKSLLAIVLLWIPFPALAQINVWCTGLPGCGAGPSNVIATNTLPGIILILATLSAGATMVFVVYAGIELVMMYGDEAKASKAKNTVIYALAGLALSVTASSIISFVVTENYVGTGSNVIVGFMQSLVRIMLTIFNTLFLMAVVLSGLRLVMAGGKGDEFSKAVSIIKWAVFGAIIVNVGRALVEALMRTFLL
jgi:hypothetical protein